jgi:uncharacterized membrane protein (UPF0127 family)
MAETKFTTVYIGDHEFNVEIADTLEKMALGLMYRGSIPENFGMLFVHDSEQTRSMWMKNTLIHLDLIFLDRDRRVVDMYINVPPCKSDPCPSYYSRKRAQYVLELRGNRATELNLKIGDSVFFILPE